MADKQNSQLVSGGNVIAKIMAIYSEPELTRPESAEVYDNRSGKSTVAINVGLTVLSCGLSLPVKVYARLGQDGKVKFEPSLPKGLKIADEHRDVFRAHVNKAVLAWSGRERAFTEAFTRLTTGKVAKSGKLADEAAPLEWSPTVPTGKTPDAPPAS